MSKKDNVSGLKDFLSLLSFPHCIFLTWFAITAIGSLKKDITASLDVNKMGGGGPPDEIGSFFFIGVKNLILNTWS